MIFRSRDHAPSPRGRIRPGYHWRVLSVITVGSMLTGMNASTLNVALPVVARHFDAGPSAAHWVLLSFMLTNTVLLVLFGRISDVVGRRTMNLGGYALFTLSSLLLGLAPSIEVLIALRVVQAIGFAMILANSTALIAHAFPADRLSQGMGVYISAISLAQVLGPSVGGLIAASAGWRWVFWFNVPIGLLAVCWGAVTLRKVPRGPREPIDVRGTLLLLGWLGGLLFAVSESSALGWDAAVVRAGLLACAVLLPVFWWTQRRTAHPLIDVSLYRDAAFSLANLAAFLHTLARFGVVLIFSLFFQGLWRVDAGTAGLAVLPVPIAMLASSPLAGLLARLAGARTVAVFGPACTAAGLLVLLPALDAGTPYWMFAVGLALMGAGSGIFLTCNTTAIMSRVPDDRLGAVNGQRLTLQNVGNTLGIAMSLTLITGPLPASQRPQVYAGLVPGTGDALLTGYRHAVIVMTAMALLSLAAAVAGMLAERAAGSREPAGP
ncbi:MFS transporter [Actinomadura sp. WMMB 499]|uniref:MFS transporter n=1 Tax=Actinomadura sp. WMMB 499 TaxID=1219491 RepID=UPI0020C78F3F|nr:MFS transporter [Actinomadura sp. WMMB 499]